MPASKGVGGRPDITMGPSTKWRQNVEKRECTSSPRETLKHRETPSGLHLRVVYVFNLFAFSHFSGTVVEKYVIFIVFAVGPNT